MKATTSYSVISNDLFGDEENSHCLVSQNKNNLGSFIHDRLYKKALNSINRRHMGPSERRLEQRASETVERIKTSASNDAIRLFMCSKGSAYEKPTEDDLSDTSSTTSSFLRTSSTSLLSNANICLDVRAGNHSGRNGKACQRPTLPTGELRERAKRIWSAVERWPIWKSRLPHSKSLGSLQGRRECSGQVNCVENVRQEIPLRKLVDTFHYGTSYDLWLQTGNKELCHGGGKQCCQLQNRCVLQSYSLRSTLHRPKESASASVEYTDPDPVEFRQNILLPTYCKECNRRVMLVQTESDANKSADTWCTEINQSNNRMEVTRVSPPCSTIQSDIDQLENWVHCSGSTVTIPDTCDVILARPHDKQPFGMRIEADPSGVYLTTVVPQSPASLAGLKVGDEVLRLNGYPVSQLCNQAITELIRSTPHYLRVSYRPSLFFPVAMVLFFKCELVQPAYVIYMGVDKNENEELIRWGWPEDVWFHVDKLSSAHVYLRLRDGETLDDVPDAVLQDCAQLVKENSIQGCKTNDVAVVYTMWDNLKKSGDMAVGQVGFHNNKLVRNIVVQKRIGEVIKRLNKTKEDRPNLDLSTERTQRDQRWRAKEKAALQVRKKAEIEAQKLRETEAERRSYDRLFVANKMRTNEDGYDSDEFM